MESSALLPENCRCELHPESLTNRHAVHTLNKITVTGALQKPKHVLLLDVLAAHPNLDEGEPFLLSCKRLYLFANLSICMAASEAREIFLTPIKV